MASEQMKIFTRTFDFLTWLLPATNHFPRTHRHTFTQRLLDAAFDFHERIEEGNARKGRANTTSPAPWDLGPWRRATRALDQRGGRIETPPMTFGSRQQPSTNGGHEYSYFSPCAGIRGRLRPTCAHLPPIDGCATMAVVKQRGVARIPKGGLRYGYAEFPIQPRSADRSRRGNRASTQLDSDSHLLG
jgi:hypothetical protein